MTAQAVELGRLEVDRVDGPGEAAGHQRVQHAMADAGGIARGADDRDGGTFEQRAQ
jgi:hypothetical protein